MGEVYYKMVQVLQIGATTTKKARMSLWHQGKLKPMFTEKCQCDLIVELYTMI